nr:pyruvate kinase-like [Nerophis lumbriciformis]
MYKSPNASTSVIATLGPVSANAKTIAALLDAGANVFRLNFSHGEHEVHEQTYQLIREESSRRQRAIGILQDLQGPKIRVRRFVDGSVELEDGANFTLDCGSDDPGDSNRAGVSYRQLYRDVSPDMMLLLDDGKLALRVTEISGKMIHTEVIRGGQLSDRKGINIPGADLSIPALTEKDIEDLAFGAKLGVDWIAMSFVRSAEDLRLARKSMQNNESTARLMAKIENPAAVTRFSEILAEADGIMVARGDLGVELSPEQVPMVQKRLIKEARESGKPVVTATQMLESMITNSLPTRAEANDVANAVFDGSDGIMLSAETATGQYPVEAVAQMNRIALTVEADATYREAISQSLRAERTVFDSVAHAACQVAREVSARIIVTFSASGSTALRVARHRSLQDILAITPNEIAYRQMAMSWGVRPMLAEDIKNSDEMVAAANKAILESGLAQKGDRYVITAGVPFGVSGSTNLIRVETVS